MISRIVGALVEPTPVAVEADADSLSIEGNLKTLIKDAVVVDNITTECRICFVGFSVFDVAVVVAGEKKDETLIYDWDKHRTRLKSKNAGEEPTKHPDFQQVDKEDQVFLDELERLKRQEQDANDAAEALRKEFAKKLRICSSTRSC
ncbi:hypothetical protein Tco_0720293 [Tanacetum coccineum]